MFSSMFSSLSQLHFLEPRWLFAFIPLALILWLFSRSRPNVSSWEKVIDHNLLPYLLQGKETKVSKLPKWLLGVGGFIAVIALANPVWEKIARPVFQTNSARVIVLDLSTSMLINDLKPSRLARARFKIEDILSRNEEGQTGLVVFAGDAFTASPLTRDVDTIRNLLQVFTPRLMPAQGSRVDYGLKKAHELLKQAGVRNGQVLLIADGVSNPTAALKAAEALKADGHTLSVLAVGTEKGGLLRLRTKQVNIKLDAEALQKVSKKGGGGYHIITSNNTDLNTVLKKAVADNNSEQDKNQSKTDDFKSDDWKSSGPYLLLLLLPIAALAFRKGWLLNLFIVFALSTFIAQPEAVYALDNAATNTETNTKTEQSFSNLVSEQWRKLWLNNEQLADRALKQKHYQQASQLSEAPLRKGSASYKSNDYKEALNAFKKAQGADALYNQGNTLAKMEKYKEAIEAYKKALKANPNMKDAQINKKAVEDFLKKKKQQEKKKQQQKNQKDKQKKDDKNKKQKGDKSGDKGKKGKDDAQKKKQGDKQGGKSGDKKSNEKNQFDKANKDLAKKKNQDNKEKAEKAKNAENADKQKQADEEKEAKEKAAKAKKAEQDKNKAEKAQDESQAKATKAAKAKAEELSKEEKMAAEQWLRRIPDDPGGLLRRKFRRQYQRNNRRPNDDQQPW